jgi:hypothetical protein
MITLPLGYNKYAFRSSLTMDQPLILRYTPTKQDYTNVLRLFFFQRTSTRVSLGFLALAFGLIVYTITSQGSPLSPFELVWLLLPPLFVAYVLFFQPSRMASRAMQNEQLAAEATWEVSDRGVKISNRFGEIQMDWDNLQKLVTAKDYYLLLSQINKNAFRFIPKRAFSSPQETERFLAFMGKNLPST